MRKAVLIVVVLAASSAAGSAEARGRIRFRLPWFGSRTPAASEVPKPAQAAGAGGLVILPFAARADSQRTAEPPPTPAGRPQEPSEAKRNPVEAVSPKPQPCASDRLFGAGTGFCAVN